MKKYIYIAGKITGEDREQCLQKFLTAETKLRNAGAIPVNPFKLGIPSHFTFDESKPHNFKALRQCSAIFALKCYVNSPGALSEIEEAKRLGIEIFYEQHEGYENVFRAINA